MPRSRLLAGALAALVCALCLACNDNNTSSTVVEPDATPNPDPDTNPNPNPVPIPDGEPIPDPGPDCSTVVEDFRAAQRAALTAADNVACTSQADCVESEQCPNDSCSQGRAINTAAATQIDEAHPPELRCGEDCRPDPEPCPEPEPPSPTCLEGVCEMTFGGGIGDVPPQNCEEKIASTTRFLDTLFVFSSACEVDSECTAVSITNGCTTACRDCQGDCYARPVHVNDAAALEAKLEAHARWNDCTECSEDEGNCFDGPPLSCINGACRFTN